MRWMFAVTEERHINRIADENPEAINLYERYKSPKLIIEEFFITFSSNRKCADDFSGMPRGFHTNSVSNF